MAIKKSSDFDGLAELAERQVAAIRKRDEPAKPLLPPQQEGFRGFVHPNGILDARNLARFLTKSRGTYSPSELRAAAALPLVQGINGTIVREVLSYRVKAKANDDTAEGVADIKRQLYSMLAQPSDTMTMRTAFSMIMRDLLTIGHADIEFLRARYGQVAQLARQYRDGVISRKQLVRQIEEARSRRGPIMGFQVYPAENIRMAMDEHGVLQTPAFYDISQVGNGRAAKMGMTVKLSEILPHWDREDFCRLYWDVKTVVEGVGAPKRGVRSPVAEGFPLIDILWTILYRVKDELDTPDRDRIVALSQPREGIPMTEDQVGTLVESLREDLAVGRLPVLTGVAVSSVDLGEGHAQQRMSVMEQFSVLLWTIWGAGLVEMGKVDLTSRATATVQRAVAQKQAVGTMQRILMDEFLNLRICGDPYSPYKVLTCSWFSPADILPLPERLKMLAQMIKYNPALVGAILETETELEPLLAALREQGIDPFTVVASPGAGRPSEGGRTPEPSPAAMPKELD